MAFINIFLSNPCKVNIENDQLIIEGEKRAEFPIEDINSVMIENHQINFSAYTLYRLAESGAAIFICNRFHMPLGIMYSFSDATRKSKVFDAQLNISKPLIKQLWQTIIKSKINNQGECLDLCGLDGKEIKELSSQVLSGDSSNIEATAAMRYFKLLFGRDFTRHQDNIINGCLNYGYTIIRGIIARTLSAYGFEPSIGLFHSNELNNFNLADDLIEPYRPLVDMYVYKNINYEEKTLSPPIKRSLYNLINLDIIINDQIQSVNYSIELMIQSLKNSILKGEFVLNVPYLTECSQHCYE